MYYKWKITSLIAVILLAIIYQSHTYKILYHNDNEPIWVYETKGIRCFSFSQPKRLIRQSCVNLKDPNELVFNYNKLLLGALYLNPRPKKILAIGLGGGSLVKALSKLIPKTKIDIVEPSPEVYKVAKSYFDFTTMNKHRVFIEDGYSYVKSTKEQYDLVIVDAFSDNYIPKSILSDNFFKLVKRTLTRDGVIAMNTLLSSKQNETKLFLNTFNNFFVLTTGNNQVVIATNNHNLMNQVPYNIKVWEKQLKTLGVDTSWLLSKFQL